MNYPTPLPLLLILALWLCIPLVGSGQNLFENKIVLNTEGLSDEEEARLFLSKLRDSSKYGKEFPELTISDIHGVPLDSSKPLVFYHFWFSSCAPCIAEIPLLNQLAETYGESVDFIALTFESKEDIVAFNSEHPLAFRQFSLDLKKLNIISGYPTNIITKNGKVIYYSSGGAVSGTRLFEQIRMLQLKEYQELLDRYMGNVVK